MYSDIAEYQQKVISLKDHKKLVKMYSLSANDVFERSKNNLN